MNRFALKQELQACAGDELRDVLRSWEGWSDEQAATLLAYLNAELQPGGLLTSIHLIATVETVDDVILSRRIERQARELAVDLAQRMNWECARCGYSRYLLRGEFRDGVPGDETRVCADCGNVNTESTLALGRCQWFAGCTNQATGVIEHPILGTVPTCEPCMEKVKVNS